ncbi:uncharacterized protein K452DRAFT_236457, partial [Aplosporella prunicola CBS 121167]
YRGQLQNDLEVEDWLLERGYFSRPPGTGTKRGKIRLLICERLHVEPPDFAMSKNSFESLMRVFDLPVETLPAFQGHNGTHFRRKRYSGDRLVSVANTVIIVKLPQIFQIENCGLSLTHYCDTGNTNAFLWGRNVVRENNPTTGKRVRPHIAVFETVLECMARSWTDPLLLPAILLYDYVDRAERFLRSDIDLSMMSLDRYLGVTRTGRNYKKYNDPLDHVAPLENMARREERVRLTSQLHTNAYNTVALHHNMQWAHRYCAFMQSTVEETTHELKRTRQETEVQESVSFLQNKLESIQDFVNQIRDRQERQLSVLSSFIDQADNDQSMKVARDARVDGLAMKALALLTAVFLPPSFIATMFSMSMFDWQAKTSSGVTSSYFWIYWAASIPLAVLLLLGWRVWWRRQRSVYDEEYCPEGGKRWDPPKAGAFYGGSGKEALVSRARD